MKSKKIFQDNLDSNLLTNEAVEAMHHVLHVLQMEAEENSAETFNQSVFLGSFFSFGPENANRPDIVNNATVGEYLDWIKCTTK